MQSERPYVLSIAGFDPCSGAGLSADIKTFEQMKVYGLAVCTGLTLQTEDEFFSVEWRKAEEVEREVDLMLNKYNVKAIKFGIVPSIGFLSNIVSLVRQKNSSIKIVVDPVWKSSSGFTLNGDFQNLADLLNKISLLTPNVQELDFMRKEKEREFFLEEISRSGAILLKGGHNDQKKGTDILYWDKSKIEIGAGTGEVWPKHGSGCVLSAAITARLALGDDLETACRTAKHYTEKYLNSNKSLLGYHAA